MRIVIVGAGEVGFSVARSLSQDGNDIVLVEEKPERAEKAENELDVMVVCGNGARPNILEKAGVTPGGGVKMLIACSGRDEVNIIACLIAKKMGIERVISRAVGLEYTDTNTWSRDLGVDMMVSPERPAAREIENLLEMQNAMYSAELDEHTGIYAFKVDENSSACGLTLLELRRNYPGFVTIIVYIRRGEEGFIPKAGDELRAGDICYSFCYIDQIHEISELYQPQRAKKLKRVLIIGAGKVGSLTARLAQSKVKGLDVRIIDADREKCRKIAAEMPAVTVLWGDGADEELLLQEGIEGTGGFVAATESDEVNLILAVQAKRLGAHKSIAVVRRKNYLRLAGLMPIDAIVSRNDALSSALISLVRYPGHANVYTLLDQIGAETVQVTIPQGSPAIGVKLADLPLPPGTLLGFVKREGGNGGLLIPTGESSLEAGDIVMVFAALEAVNDALAILGVNKD